MRVGFVPGNNDAGTMGAEDGIRGIPDIPAGIISFFTDDLFRIRTGLPVQKSGGQAAAAFCEDSQLAAVFRAGGGGNRRGQAAQVFPGVLRYIEAAAHQAQIAHDPADTVFRNGDIQRHPGFQQDAAGFHQPLAEGAVGSLAEITAFGMLEMRFSGDQRDVQIRYGGTGEHAHMYFFPEMGYDEPLPVEGQIIRGNR